MTSGYDQMQVEGIARDLGRTIASALPGGLGFAVLVFDFGDGGTMAYMSNAKREQMIRALRELIDKLEKG